MRTPIATIRRVCKLLNDEHQGYRSIGRICNISPNTVKRIYQAKTKAKLVDINGLSDEALKRAINPPKQTPNSKSVTNSGIDWQTVHDDLQKRDVTRQLAWEEYRSNNAEGLSYSQFCRQYRKWRKTVKVSLRQVHRPGESVFVDFCGRTMPIRDKTNGELWKAQVFVGVLGASGYIFATAVKSQKITDFLSAHVLMLEHLNGVPKYVVTDNLKSAVIKNTKEQTELNTAYNELAEHYNFIILPARPRKPKDKAMAEVGVQIVQRWVLARLRHQVFFDLDELNQQIAYWMTQLNQRTTRTYTVSRSERLESLDRQELQPLPEQPYRYSTWAYSQRVDDSYHVSFQNRLYSVPYQYAHRLVDIRATNEYVDIYWQRDRIARHNIDVTTAVVSDPSHQPPEHQYASNSTPDKILAWATGIGPAAQHFVERNLADTRHYAAKLKSLINLRNEVSRQSWQSNLEQSCAFVIKMNCFSVSRLCAVLKRHTFQAHPANNKSVQHRNVRGPAYYSK